MYRMLIIVTAIFLAVCAPVLAGSKTDNGLDVRLGAFYLSDGSADDFAGTGTGIDVEKKVLSLPTSDLYASVGWIKFSKDDEIDPGFSYSQDITLVPVMLTLRSDTQSGRSAEPKVYYGIGAGAVLKHLEAEMVDRMNPLFNGSVDDDEVDFAWQLVAGMRLGTNIQTEAKYLDGGDDYSTGFWLSIGSSF